MKVAIASGKGGTGKTSLAVSLALALESGEEAQAHARPPLHFMDCDVEAPDAHLFLHPKVEDTGKVEILVPEIDQDRCSLCGDCIEACQFNALALLGPQVLVFREMCHGCGSCTLVCPEKAISELPRSLGRVESGTVGELGFSQGLLNVGEALAVPVIRKLKGWAQPGERGITILDAPPGTSCPVVETVKGTDFVVLVTEPTPMGLHDLELAVETVRELGIPLGVIVNRDGIGDDRVDKFCAREGLPILLRIPFSRRIAEGIARGGTLLDVHPELGGTLREMMNQIKVLSGAEVGA